MVPLHIKCFILPLKSQVAGELQTFSNQIKERNETILPLQSYLTLSSVSHLELNLAEQNSEVSASTYVELPTFLDLRYFIIKVQNTDDRCLCLLGAFCSLPS